MKQSEELNHDKVGHGIILKALIDSNLIRRTNYLLPRMNFSKTFKTRIPFCYDGLCYLNIYGRIQEEEKMRSILFLLQLFVYISIVLPQLKYWILAWLSRNILIITFSHWHLLAIIKSSWYGSRNRGNEKANEYAVRGSFLNEDIGCNEFLTPLDVAASGNALAF